MTVLVFNGARVTRGGQTLFDADPDVPTQVPTILEEPVNVTVATQVGDVAEITLGLAHDDEQPAVFWYYVDGDSNEVEFAGQTVNGTTAIIPPGANGFTYNVRLTWEFGDRFATRTLTGGPISGVNATWPQDIPQDDWLATETFAEPFGRRRIWVKTIVQSYYDSNDFELRYYSGIESSPVFSEGNTTLVDQFETNFRTSDTGFKDQVFYNFLLWKNVSTGDYRVASPAKLVVLINGSDTTTPVDPGDPDPVDPPDPPPPPSGEPIATAARTSISQYGFTVNFDKPVTTGVYANGDWFIVSDQSFNITSITPQWDGEKHGAMRNPAQGFKSTSGGTGDGTNQGADSRPVIDNKGNTKSTQTWSYAGNKNVDPAQNGNISVSVNEEFTITKWRCKPSPLPSGDPKSTTLDMAVFTVVKSVPAKGAFRPAPWAPSKASVWVTGGLDLSLLPDLSLPSNLTSYNYIVSRLQRPHQTYHIRGTKHNLSAANNQERGGREYATTTAEAGMYLCGNISTADKRRLAELVVQLGIEIYERVRLENGCYHDDGQLNGGRKLPMVIAAMLLNDSGMKSYANGLNRSLWRIGFKGAKSPRLGVESPEGPIFMEDRQTFYVSQTLIDNPPQTGWNNGSTPQPYPQSMLGKPEWGIEAWSHPDRNNYGQNAAYRWSNLQYLPGTTMVAHLIPGMRAVWNWPALFDYVDFRYDWWKARTAGVNAVPNTHKEFYDAHRWRGGPIYPKA